MNLVAWLVSILLVLLAIMAWLWSRRLHQQSGLPTGHIFYTDTSTWFPNNDPLYATDLQLVGKPDYLVEEADGSIIPVEIKSSRSPSKPYPGHVLQLAAYCLLVEENYGKRPDYGILKYSDRSFAIDYTTKLESQLIDLVTEMREDMFEGELGRDHNDWQKCARCGVRKHCYERLA